MIVEKMTFLIKIQLLNWQQNVYRSTSCPQNWASVCTSHTNKSQSQVAITFEKHKLDEDCFRARFGRMIRALWLNTRSTGADGAGTDKTFSNSGCNIWIVASAFSCNHGSSIGTDDFPALLPVPDTPSNYLPSPPWDFRSSESVQPCTCSYIDTTLNNSTTNWAH